MEPTEYFILILFIALGIFSVIAAILNLDWYFQTSGAMTFVRWLGRKGARIFYALLGLGLISSGIDNGQLTSDNSKCNEPAKGRTKLSMVNCSDQCKVQLFPFQVSLCYFYSDGIS